MIMRKLLAVMLALVVLFTMVACGGNKKGNNSVSSNSGSSVTQSSNSDDNSSSTNSSASDSSNKSEIGTTNGEIYSKIITFTSADLNKTKTTKFVQPKNVIYMIGDGMGLNDIAICNKFSETKFEFGLLIDHLPNIGIATTHSASNSITDSAAGGNTLHNKENYELSEVTFTTNQHSAADVGVFAMGYGTEHFNNKKVDNTDIALFVMLALRGKLKR